MKLTHQEQQWLEAYKRCLTQNFPGLVERIVLFGSKARETATPDSDLDILLIIREGDWRLKDQVTEPGYDLSLGTDVVPSIMVYTRAEWDAYQHDETPFWKTVTRDGIALA